MNKLLFNAYLVMTNIKNYGLQIFIKSVFYEFYYLLKFKDFKSIFFSANKVDSYLDTKFLKSYSTPNIPTPYYFLNIIKNFLKKKNLNNFILIDLGCGHGRVGHYFDSFFKINFLGIDIDPELVAANKILKNKKNFYFLNINLKRISSLNKIKKFIEKKKIVFFISDSFDAYSIFKLIEFFNKDYSFYLIMVNQKNMKYFYKFTNIFSIRFNNSARNINIYKIL
jgi:hypothetical protein